MNMKATVLVVEDERIVAEDIQRCLKSLGYEVSGIASTGKEAIQSLRKQRPDLVLMDIVIKGKMSGIETAKEIMAAVDLPIVYLTAYTDTETLEEAKLTEPFGYIVKPYNDRELYSTIEMALYKHRLDQRIKESEARFRLIAENIQDGLIIVENGLPVYANDRACSIYGYSRDELLQMNHFDSALPEEHDRIKQAYESAGEKGEVPKPLEFWIERKDGKKCYIQNRYSVYHDDDGVRNYIVTTDMTERKEAEEALRKSEKLAGLGKMASNIVHEVGNPLAAISNSIQVLQGRVSLEGRMKELMDIIGWETERLNRIIDMLREFSKPRQLHLTDCDIKEVVLKAINVINQDFDLVFGRHIKTRFSNDLPSVEADPDALQQVALNLLRNAMQAIDEGGHVQVNVKYGKRPAKGSIVLEIQDNGPGIPEENLDQIFEPYFSTKARGMGLGMHIVKQIVDMHNGEIVIRSEAGKGTLIQVIIPCRRDRHG